MLSRQRSGRGETLQPCSEESVGGCTNNIANLFLMLRNIITSQTELSFLLCNWKQRSNNMSPDWERERFDNPIVLFNNQSLSMGEDGSSDILTFKFPADEISRTIDLNFAMRVNFSDKGDLPFCNRDIKIPIGVNISFKGKTLW